MISSTPARAPISPVSPGDRGYWQLQPEAGGVLRPLRTVAWVREGGIRPREGVQVGHTAQREGRQGLGAQPWRQGSWGRGALADPLWSLVRWAQNPFSREKRRCGLKGYEGAGGC